MTPIFGQVFSSGHFEQNGETGWLFEPDDADSLAAALQTALSLGTDARERLESQQERITSLGGYL